MIFRHPEYKIQSAYCKVRSTGPVDDDNDDSVCVDNGDNLGL